MNGDQIIYEKCGEIFLGNETNYTFLCYFCNELLYEFDEFKTHSLLHLKEVDSSNKLSLDGSEIIVEKGFELNYQCEEAPENISSLVNKSAEIEFNEKESENHISSDSEQDVADNNHETNALMAERLWRRNKIKAKSYPNKKFCLNCKLFFKLESHDNKKCFKIQELVKKYDGDFISLLREGIFYCNQCRWYFENYIELYKHHKSSKHCIENDQCKICKFPTIMDSKKNMSSNEDNFIEYFGHKKRKKPDIFKCSCCEKKFKTNYQMKRHMKIHTDERQHEFDDKDNFIEYFDDKPNILFKCSSCEKKFETNYQMKCHMKMHTDATQYKCDNEGKIIEHFDDKKREKPDILFKCPTCEKQCKTYYQMKIHMIIHTNERPYKCEICLGVFKSETYLKCHIKKTHERPLLSCRFEGCDEKFKTYNLKREHERTHPPAGCQCEICGKYFILKRNLLRHQRTNHVDKKLWKYQCEFCNRRFSRWNALEDHKRVHTGEKPYGCDICSTFFRKRSHLREHKKLHSEETKHLCLLCGKGFKQGAGYWCHMKRHHDIC